MKKDFVATVLIFEKSKVLLVWHPKFLKWLPPGGHIEKDELPHLAAKREVLEETGYEISFIKKEEVQVERSNASTLPSPYLILLEEVPETPKEKAHQHIDLLYVAKPSKHRKDQIIDPHEMRWFTLEECLDLKGGEEIFVDTQDVLTQVMPQFTQEESLR